MLQWIGYISFGFSALGLLLLGVSLLQKTKKKSLKGRKKIRTLRRLYAGVAAFFFLTGIILEIMAVPKGDWRTFIDLSTPVEAYQNRLKASDAAGAVDFLPERIYAAGDDYYIATGKNAVYGHLAMTTVTTDASGAQLETVSYQNGLFQKSVSMIGGGNTFLAVLNSRERLNLYGAFEYQQYERGYEGREEHALIPEKQLYVAAYEGSECGHASSPPGLTPVTARNTSSMRPFVIS